MKCLVTGGTGFIGSNLVSHLQSLGHDVSITGSDVTQKLPGFKGKCYQASFVGIDWKRMPAFDVVFHQAAINDTTLTDSDEMLRVNVKSSLALFEDAISKGCKRIVYASSTAMYGNTPTPHTEDGPFDPLNVYAESKLQLDKEVQKLMQRCPDVVIVGLRYCNVYGPGENRKGKRSTMVYQLAQQMITGDPRIFEFGEQARDYIYVKDVVSANLLAAQAKQSRIVNCGSGQSTSFNEIIEILNKNLGLNRKPTFIKNPYTTYQHNTLCDMTLARNAIHFIPEFSMEKGISEYYSSGALVSLDN